jgi:HAD superfamily hydrolase (TIGR01509 family)
VKALLLDLYDTIAWTDWQELSDRLSRRLEVEPAALLRGFEATRLGRGIGHHGSVAGNLGAVAAAAGARVGPALLDELAAETIALLERNVHLYDDVLPTIRQLRASGVRMAVVSNCDHATRPVLDHLGLAREVDAVVLSFEVGSLKPEAPIFTEALRRLEASASDALFVDDQTRYLQGAEALGIRTARIARRRSYGETTEPGPQPVIEDLTVLALAGEEFGFRSER